MAGDARAIRRECRALCDEIKRGEDWPDDGPWSASRPEARAADQPPEAKADFALKVAPRFRFASIGGDNAGRGTAFHGICANTPDITYIAFSLTSPSRAYRAQALALDIEAFIVAGTGGKFYTIALALGDAVIIVGPVECATSTDGSRADARRRRHIAISRLARRAIV